MMKLSFYKLSPMGNSTVLVDNTEGDIHRESYIKIANLLMNEDYLACEQVGFICSGEQGEDYKLEMMGGELCVNALRSLGYLNFIQTNRPVFNLSSLGSEGIFEINVSGEDEVTLKFDMEIEHIQLTKTLSLVHLDGISHFIEELPSVQLDEGLILNRHQELCTKYVDLIKNIEAIGYIPYQRGDDDGKIKITPLVYVVHTETKVFETACGSGTIAVGVHEYGAIGSVDLEKFEIVQPSNAVFKLSLRARSIKGFAVKIASKVKLVAEGTVYLDDDLV